MHSYKFFKNLSELPFLSFKLMYQVTRVQTFKSKFMFFMDVSFYSFSWIVVLLRMILQNFPEYAKPQQEGVAVLSTGQQP